MWWFNLAAGTASLLGLGLSVWAILTARDARARVAAFERHEDATAVLREVARCKVEVRELQRSRTRVWPRGRCDALAASLAVLLARPLRLTEEERDRLGRFLSELNRGEIDNDRAAAGRLRSLVATLAKMEARILSVARTEAQP